MNTLKLVCCCISLLILQKILYAYSDQKLVMSSKFYAKTNALDCFGNPDILKNISCKLKAINWERTIANMDVDVVVLLRNVSVRFEVFKYTNQFRPFLVNLTINACDLLSRRKSFIYANVAFDIIGKYSNMNHTCPYLLNAEKITPSENSFYLQSIREFYLSQNWKATQEVKENVHNNFKLALLNWNRTPYGHVIARDIFMDTRYIPFNMPTGKYKFVFNFYEGWPWVYVGTIAAVTSLEERRNVKRPKSRPKQTKT